jgi:hypothetical protein
MEQKVKDENKASEKNLPPVKKNNNKMLLWILGGCLAVILIFGLIAAGLFFWGMNKIKNEIKNNDARMGQWESNPKQAEGQAGGSNEQTNPASDASINSETGDSGSSASQLQDNSNASQNAEGMQPFSGEKQIGYIKKVYTKGGKNYLDIDYIQWLTGAEAQKAMREDGECPKTGECIVMDDYYIRNVNPQIRTFEILPNIEIMMQTYTMEKTGQIQPKKISFSQFSQIWNTNTKSSLKNVPYIVEISSNQIIKINEQYVP